MNLFNGSPAHGFAGTLGVLDMHPEQGFDQNMETTAGEPAHPWLGLMQDRSWKPTRTDNAIGFTDPFDQIVEGVRRRGAICINVTNHLRERRELQPFDQCA